MSTTSRIDMGFPDPGVGSDNCESVVAVGESSSSSREPGFQQSLDENSDSGDLQSLDESPDWGGVAEEILQIVLTKLPLSSVLRSKAVCKAWNSAIQTARFPPFPPCCVLYSDQQVLVFDIGEQKWHDWEHFYAVPRSLLVPSSFSHRPPFAIIAGAGSFLVFESKMQSHLTVFNPLNKSYQHFPRPAKNKKKKRKLSLYSSVCSLKIDKGSSRWKLFDRRRIDRGVISSPDPVETLIFKGSSRWEFFDRRRIDRGVIFSPDPVETFSVYDSGDGSWDCQHELDPPLNVSNSGELVQVTEGIMYYLAKIRTYSFPLLGPDRGLVDHYLCVYDLEKRKGQVLQIVWILDPIGFAHLFEWHGKVILLGSKSQNTRHTIKDPLLTPVSVWELDETSMEWIEVSTMPAELQAKFYFEVEIRNLFRLSFASSGDYVGIIELHSKRLLVLFNVLTKAWTWVSVPQPPQLPDAGGSDGIGRKFVMFEPNLDALV